MGAVALTSLGGLALSVEADLCTSALDLPAALRPVNVATACRVRVAGVVYDLQGAAATVNAAIDRARSWRRVVLAADVDISTVALADITGLAFAVEAGKRYVFWGSLVYTVAAATTGAAAALSGPTPVTSFFARIAAPSTVSTMNDRATGSYDSPSAAFSASPNQASAITIDGWVQPNTAGNIQARGCSEVGGTAVTFKAGSFLEWREVA